MHGQKKVGKAPLPATRSLRYMRVSLGLITDPVERRVGPFSHDLWELFDLLGLDMDTGELYFVQVTSRSNMAVRRDKIAGSDEAAALLLGGNQVELHGWDIFRGYHRLKRERMLDAQTFATLDA